MEQSVKPLLPYIATVIIIFILGFLVPEIVTWLPGLIYG
jgi:TRAP-type C4-dicarboxylate transport system permease large subunit